jgi:hypothetical protein
MAFKFNIFTGKLDYYEEADTLQTVTTRGATTDKDIVLGVGTAVNPKISWNVTAPAVITPMVELQSTITACLTELGQAIGSGFFRGTQGTNGGQPFYVMVGAVAGNSIFGSAINGDAYRRFLIYSSGQLNWGDGTTSVDTNLYRSGANTLATDDNFVISGNKTLTLGSGTSHIITSNAQGIIGISGNQPLLTLTDTNGRISRYGGWAVGSGSAYVTTNAYFDGSNWQRDQTDRNSVFLSLDSATNLLRFRYALAGANPITPLTAFQVSTLGVLQAPKLSPIADSTTAMQFLKADGTTAVMNLDTTNARVGIGTTAPASTLDVTGNFKLTGSADIWFGSPTGAIKVGADVNANTRSSNTRKLASFAAPDYDNTRNVEFLNFDSPSSASNALNLGGRSGGSQYGATSITFLTTATPSTTGGAIAMTITSASKVGIGTTAPANILHVLSTTEQLRLGYDASNYLSATVGSAGSTTFALTGTAPTFTFSQGVTFSDGITLADAKNIILNTTTGTKVGTATGQKLGFWNVTPVSQQAHIADATGGLVVDTEARAAIASINALLATLGLTAAS